MSDFGRYGGTDYQDRERRWRDTNRGRGGFFSSDSEDRGFPGAGEDRPSRFFSSDRDDVRGGGRDRERERERSFRDNRPQGRSEESGLFGRDRERGQSRFGNDDDRRSLPIDETEQLIASNKVEGTPVYGREGERLGTIYNFMVDKYSGRVTYAVMSYGGFLGVGQRYYPMPWKILSYDTHEGGYRVDMDYHDLERAPSFGRDDEPRFSREYGRRVHSWYGLDY